LTTKNREGVFDLFGDDPFLPNDRRFSIEKIRIVPDLYFKGNWAIRVIELYREGCRLGRVPVYPPEPPSKRNPSRYWGEWGK
jgi:hypothetical protein